MGEEMTKWPEKLFNPAEPLRRLLEALALDASVLPQREEPDELNYYGKISASSFVTADDSEQQVKKREALNNTLLALLDAYGDALSLKVKIEQLTVLEVDAGYDDAKLDEFYGKIDEETPLILDLKVDKGRLLTLNGVTHPLAVLKFFFFADSLARALCVPLTELEQGLFRDADGVRKLIILVAQHEIDLDGEYLTILGGRALDRWQEVIPNGALDAGKVRHITAQAAEELKWVHFRLSHLTPLQLNVGWATPECGPSHDDPVAAALYAQLFASSLLYTGGHSTFNDEGNSWLVTYAADKYVAKFEVNDAEKLSEAMKAGAAGSPWLAGRAVAGIASWAYEGGRGVSDRLSVLQGVYARSFQGCGQALACRELARQGTEISDRVKGGWEAFVEGKLDKYFTQVKDLEAAVAESVKGYNEQVSTLSKTLIESMLAAVGVIVASLFVAILKSPFEARIFRLGSGLYVLYLLIFPISFGLVSAWQRYKSSKKAFDRRKEEFDKRLSKEEVDKIIGNAVSESEGWFRNWFFTTTGAYLLVLLLMVVSIIFVPGVLRRWGDDFELTEATYSDATGSQVQVVVRGDNFDKDKEIVVTVGDLKFTNTDGETLKVHGSTVLTLSPPIKSLTVVASSGSGQIAVRQGLAGPKMLALPKGPPPILKPTFQRWTYDDVSGESRAVGTGFDSISDITIGGRQAIFNVIDGGKSLSIPSYDWRKATNDLHITLNNGEQIQVPIPKESKENSQ